MTDSATALYLFCLARSGRVPELSATGVDGQSPLLVRRFGELAAVLSIVSVADFCGPGAEARMKDLSWLGPRVRRHEAVLEQVMAHSPLLPARFGTLFSSPASLERLLPKHQGTIAQFLDHVTGHEEWGIKGVLNRTKAMRELECRYQIGGAGRESSTAVSPLSPGIRYLQARRVRAEAEKDLSQWLQATCARVAGTLRGYASDFSMRKPIAHGVADG